jgi:hypothetical protein
LVDCTFPHPAFIRDAVGKEVKRIMQHTNTIRRGTFLVVVLGLISLLLALTIGLTVKVRAGMLQAGNIQSQVSYYLARNLS